MSETTLTDTVDSIRKFINKFAENHHEIEDVFNQELNKVLSKSEILNLSAEECNEVITELNKALDVVERNVNHTLINVKDRLKQAKIDALERKLMHCTCQDVTRREYHTRANITTMKCDSGVGSTTCSTDSRIFSEPGDAPVVQPTDAPKIKIDVVDDNTDANADKSEFNS